jgi:Ase1/PRC1/MAP65 family protein
MLELKRSTMSTFIANARSEIEEVWNELMYDESDRRAFENFFDGMLIHSRLNCFLKTTSTDEHTEELLVLHERELERLRMELKSKSRILTAVKKYIEICEEEKELAVCPGIFLGTRYVIHGTVLL